MLRTLLLLAVLPALEVCGLRPAATSRGRPHLNPLRGQPEKYIAPALEQRLKSGLVTAGDLERMFGLSVRQTERILHETSRPFDIGVVVSLESVLVDLTVPAGYAWAALSPEIGQRTPNPLRVKEVTGLTFREALPVLDWGALPASVLPKAEARYHEILQQFLESDVFPVKAREGAADLLQRLRQRTRLRQLRKKSAPPPLHTAALLNLL